MTRAARGTRLLCRGGARRSSGPAGDRNARRSARPRRRRRSPAVGRQRHHRTRTHRQPKALVRAPELGGRGASHLSDDPFGAECPTCACTQRVRKESRPAADSTGNGPSGGHMSDRVAYQSCRISGLRQLAWREDARSRNSSSPSYHPTALHPWLLQQWRFLSRDGRVVVRGG
jgi:hypothetical protein